MAVRRADVATRPLMLERRFLRENFRKTASQRLGREGNFSNGKGVGLRRVK